MDWLLKFQLIGCEGVGGFRSSPNEYFQNALKAPKIRVLFESHPNLPNGEGNIIEVALHTIHMTWYGIG